VTVAENRRAELLEIARIAVENDEQILESRRIENRRTWAATALSLDLDVCRSILAGRPVIAKRLDWVVLQRALRGMPLPDPNSFIRVRDGHLDAVEESGPFGSRRAA
jgi:hypothetical protein